jgi:hypothetical protein
MRGAARLRRLERDFARRALADMTQEEIEEARELADRGIRDGFETLSREDQKRAYEIIFLCLGEYTAL